MIDLSYRACGVPLAALLLAVAPAAAGAATLHRSLGGTSLAIDSPCARLVEVNPAPGATSIQVTATADHPEELDQLRFDGGAAAWIHKAGDRCWRPDGSGSFKPTLELTVLVPEHLALRVGEAGSSRYRIGRIDALLDLRASGTIDLAASEVTSLSVDVAGAGQITIGAMDGEARVSISGDATLAIDRTTARQVTLRLGGAGSIRLRQASIGQLTVQDSGTVAVTVDGTVHDARVDLSGVGSVALARLTGHLTRSVSGLGRVTVGGG